MNFTNLMRLAAMLPTLLIFAGGCNSAYFAAEKPSNRDMVYKTVGSTALKIDLYTPTTPAPAAGYPLIISIHGGAWSGGDRHNDLNLLQLTHHGYALATIDYRLSREAKFPAQIADVRDAVGWLVAHSDSLQLNSKKFVATGISAGGHLALLLGLSQGANDRTIKAVCALYGPTDLVSIVPEKSRGDRRNPVAALLGGSVSEKIDQAKAGSPVNYVSKSSVPILLYHGGRDTLVPVEQSIELNDAMKAAGAESTLIIYKDRGHAFGLDDAALSDITVFFDRVLNK